MQTMMEVVMETMMGNSGPCSATSAVRFMGSYYRKDEEVMKIVLEAMMEAKTWRHRAAGSR